MTSDEAVIRVQTAIEAENYLVRDHCEERMSLRGMFWPDILSVVENATGVRTDGADEHGRERWFFKGMTTARSEVEVLCLFENDGSDTVIFWTIYWDK